MCQQDVSTAVGQTTTITKGGGEHDDFPWEAGVFDAHCHPTTTAASIESIRHMRARGLAVMATRIQDQDLVASAAREQGIRSAEDLRLPTKTEDGPREPARKVAPAFGYHPWFAHLIYDDRLPAEKQTFDPAQSGDDRQQQQEQVSRHLRAVLRPSPAADDDDAVFFASHIPAPQALSDVIAGVRAQLLSHPHALVGEVGLDKAFRLPQPRSAGPDGEADPPAEDERDLTPGGRYGRALSRYRVDMAHQETVLKAQIALAGELGRAVSVHGVQAHGILFSALSSSWKGHEIDVPSRRQLRMVAKGAEQFEDYDSDEEKEEDWEQEEEDQQATPAPSSTLLQAKPPSPPPGSKPYPPRICLHSFSGSVETLREYTNPAIPSRIFFSFSTAVNLSTPAVEAKLPDVIRACPDDRLLVESDLHMAGDEMDAALERMYRFVCECKGWGLKDGVERIARNYEEFIFG